MPGDKFEDSKINTMIRVNHAGEYAAKRIYEGQLRYIKGKKSKAQIEEMAKGEEKHLAYFEEELRDKKARPTLLFPLVDKLSYALGAVTAVLGKEAAMVCTSSVEDVIAQHYKEQMNLLGDDKKHAMLKSKIAEFREEELEHKDIADQYDLAKAPAYKALSAVIKGGCRAAIKIVKYL